MQHLRRIAPFAVVGVVLGVWWITAARSAIFPTPLEVMLGIADLARAGTLAPHVQASLLRVALGYGGALALAIPLGSVMGWYGGAFHAFNPMIQLLRPIWRRSASSSTRTRRSSASSWTTRRIG